MENGNRQEVERGTGRFSLLYFDRYTIELNEFGEMTQSRWREPKERFLSELLWPADDERDRRYRQELIAEGHQRLVAPLYTVRSEERRGGTECVSTCGSPLSSDL